MSYVHLHRHSEWSIGDGTGTSEQYAERVAEMGQPALAITDHGSLAGTLYHMQACETAGIKPILGMEAYFRFDVDKDREDKKQWGFFHLVLLAQNMEGWKNLMYLSSRSHDDDHFYQKPCVDWKLLQSNSSGLIATSSCLAGFIPQALMAGEYDLAGEYIDKMQGVFGDRFYFEIQPHDIPEQRAVNEYIVSLAMASGIPFVATADVHSPYRDWTETQAIRVMIGYNKTVNDKKKDESNEDKEYGGLDTTYLMSDEELRESFRKNHSTLSQSEIDSAIKCSLEIADRCEHIYIDKSPKIPHATGSIMEAERVLRQWCIEGLHRTGKANNQEYVDRMNEELAVMKKLKVMDYFVFVGDMVRWAKSTDPLPSEKESDPSAKKKPIRIGPGRGSAGGSLVCYLIKITAMDPIGYDLLFERFLNEYRTEIPDIDIDIDPRRRPLLKQYLIERWGDEYVIDVAAFQSFGLKAAVKDVARALGVNFMETERATKSIPDKTYGETLESLEKVLEPLRNYFERYPEVRKHSTRLQGQIKTPSKHAAAVIVTNVPADQVIPLMRSKDGGIVTQWSERANAQLLSPYGFLKVDMLVTDDLATQAMAIDLIEERHGIKIDFEDPKQFPVMENPLWSEQDVVESFTLGRNLGVFQFGAEGSSIGGLLKDIKPTNLDHVIACNALYRPGTLTNGVAFDYAKRKNGEVEWSLPHEAAEPYLAKTFGIIVFQEQVMQIYRALGKDVESSESAVFLKVVAKGIARDLKGKEKLQAYYKKFAAGCMEKGIPKSSYDEIWENILQMTTYSFNRSHSAGYGLQAYQDQWLKNRYSIELYGPLLSTEEKKIPQIIRESRHFGIKILPPDINKSDAEFTLDGDSIRFGLLAVKGIAWAGLQEIKNKRPFSSYEDFEARVEKRKCNAKAKKALAECGALDSLGCRGDWDNREKAAGEKRILGLALSTTGDLAEHKKVVESFIMSHDELVKSAEEETDAYVGGEIIKTSDHKTKRGNPYKRADVEFGDEVYHLTFFTPRFDEILEEGTVILAAGSYDIERDNISVRHCVTAEQLASEVEE